MKKKVLYIHHSGGMGGAPRSLAFLVSELDQSKYEPVIWMIRDGEARSLFESTQARVIYNSNKWIQAFHGTTVSGMSIKTFLKNTVGYYPTYWFAKKLITEINPDIIHLSTSCLFAFAKAAKKVNQSIRVVSHIREPLLPNYWGNILLKQNMKYVDEFIAISQFDAKPFIEHGAKVRVVHNFVNIESYNKSIEKRNDYRNKLSEITPVVDKTLVVSYFARVTESNGVLELLKIAERLLDYKDIKFFVFGYTGASEYEKNIEKLKPKNVFLMPMIQEVKEYLDASDLLISPFTTPHFSRAVVEAAAMGIPVIVSNVGSQNELVVDKQTGFLYGAIEEGAAAIAKFFEHKELLLVMGNANRQLAERAFSSERNALETFKAYD